MKKIFGIGWPKTGTSSLGFALKNLGYKHLKGHWKNSNKLMPYWINNQYDKLFKIANQYQSFEDIPWAANDFFIHLNKEFPNSKFILTIRDQNDWLLSLKKMVINVLKPKIHTGYFLFHNKIFGHNYFPKNDSYYTEIYKCRNNMIIQYFENHHNFFILDVSKDNSWIDFYHFLNKEVPTKNPFPHKNKSKQCGKK